MKKFEEEQENRYEQFRKVLDVTEPTLDQRRDLMDLIMREAWSTAIKEAPYPGNILDDTDEADEAIEKRFQIVVKTMLQLKQRYGLPIPKYDSVTKRAYVEYSDGHREYFDGK